MFGLAGGAAGVLFGVPLAVAAGVGGTAAAGWHWGHSALARRRAAAEVDADENDGIPVPINDVVRRAPGGTGQAIGETMTGATPATGVFDFRAHAEEMHTAARTALPGGMMEVLTSFLGMPEALQHIAMTYEVIATRALAEMPMDPQVPAAIDAVTAQLKAAALLAESVPTLFQSLHADEIARHTAPRPGEALWDTSNN